jgi:NADH:ubiquinone oxidoreductase subunit 6 (subunit J)
MLTPQGDTGTLLDGPLRSPSALLVALAVFVVTVATLAGSDWPRSVAPPVNIPTTESIGRGLFTSYVLPLEIASVLLLIAMIGAIVVARED